MTYHHTLACDSKPCANPAGRSVQPWAFEERGETFQDAVDSHTSIGWRVGADGRAECRWCVERGDGAEPPTCSNCGTALPGARPAQCDACGMVVP